MENTEPLLRDDSPQGMLAQILALESELKGARFLIWALLKQSGGEVRLPLYALAEVPQDAAIVVSNDPASMSLVYRIAAPAEEKAPKRR